MSADLLAQVVVSATIVGLLIDLWLLLYVVRVQTPVLYLMYRYHSPWIINAALLFFVQILHLLGLVNFEPELLGLWGVLSFALVPLCFALHVVALVKSKDRT